MLSTLRTNSKIYVSQTAATCSRVGTVESPADRIATSNADKFMPMLEEQTKQTAKTTEENRECKKMMETRTDYYLDKALADLRSCSQWSGESSSRQTQLPWTRPCYVCGRHGHYARESIKITGGFTTAVYTRNNQQHRESGNGNPQYYGVKLQNG